MLSEVQISMARHAAEALCTAASNNPVLVYDNEVTTENGELIASTYEQREAIRAVKPEANVVRVAPSMKYLGKYEITTHVAIAA